MVRKLFHSICHSVGFDIVSVRNMEAEIARRERERHAAKLQQIQDLRRQQKEALPSNGGTLNWTSREQLIGDAVKQMKNADVVLDIGCAFRPQQYVDARIHICCEPFGEYMDRLMVETADDSRYVYLKADANAACGLFPERSVDTIFMTDVIEHIDRDVGVRILQGLKAIARKQIIIFTPLGYMDQDPSEDGRDPWGMGGAEWQKHRSGWVPEDFPSSDGWTIVACKDFHGSDGYERQLDRPFGAFWAIWNSNENTD